MRRKKHVKGDIFVVYLENNRKKYFQYLTNDLIQLNSEVIKVFKKDFHKDETPDLIELVNKSEIDFYAHCILKFGVKLNFWKMVGNCETNMKQEILFRSSSDDGNLQVKVSNNWWVWKINEEQKYVGVLNGENRKAEIGSVIPPDSIVHKMQYGEYDFVYPRYE